MNPNAYIINFAAGLEGRNLRLDNGQFEWWDIDFPEVITLRRQIYPEFQDNPRFHQIEDSLLNPSWSNSIPKDPLKPLLIIAEGLLSYFTAQENKQLFQQISREFPNAIMIFDCIGTWVAARFKKSHKTLNKMSQEIQVQFGLDTVDQLHGFVPTIQSRCVKTYYDEYYPQWGFFGNLIGKIRKFREQFKIFEITFR
jgi:O-methyltransferase involved in polyketide biosynthesis